MKDEKTLLTVGNLSCTGDVEILLEGVGKTIPAEAQATLLYAEDMHAHNTFETPEAVTPTAVHIDPARPFVIPKAAILAIRF